MNVHGSISPTGQTASIRFTGANGTFRRLVTRGALLELVTFGFYRFWLATDMRRYLWSSTEIDGDALEYTGRGKELLLGFLFAMAVLAPIFLLYFLVGLAFERFKAFSSVPLYAFFFLFGQFAVYRARRYRLTRTIWRGVRFWMTGSGWSYALRSVLWGLLLIPTLGFAYPWQMAALERYKMGHTFYGDLPGRFDATGWQLFKRVWWVWVLGLCPMIIILVGGVMAAIAEKTGVPPDRLMIVSSGLVVFLGVLLCIALPFLHAVRKATEWRWWAEGIRFGDVAVGCVLPRGGLVGVYWAMIGMSLLVILGFALLGGGIVALIFFNLGRAGFGAEMAHLPVWAFIGYGVWYLSMALTFGVVARIYTLQRIWQRVANACLLHNPGAAANVMAAGEAASALGEGLADGLDFAGF
jgi:uncharacterized membrane protein YjgN (DUF898 family)